MPSLIPSFYNQTRVNIWVEDPLSADYLTAVWPNSNFHFIVSGGIAGAKAMAKRASDDHLPIHVFAVVDRDLGTDNEARWADAAWPGVVFRPSVLEVENFLLDEVALAVANGNAAKKNDHEIHQLFTARASYLAWWMTCKRVLAEINSIRNQAFPADKLAHPDQVNPIGTVGDAVALLEQCVWATNTLPTLTSELTNAALRVRVEAAHAAVLGWLAGNDWRREFSGKELFNWVYGQISSGAGGTRPASIESLAAEVGAIQAASGRVPPSLTSLEASIRRRAGL